MSTRVALRYGAIAAVMCFTMAAGRAAVIDFVSGLPLGNLPQTVTVSGLTVSGFAVSKANNTQWMNNVLLNNRNEGSTEFGLGVCADITNCPATGHGNINEIDNNGSTFDVIRLDFGSSTLVASIALSSLDTGLKDGYAIFGSNTAQPNLGALTALAQGTNQSAGSVTPSVTLNQSFRYFFVAPLNRAVSDSGSDFLLRSATTSPVPEPMSAWLLGAGLAGLGLFRRAKRQS